jgi:xanthine/CO dehydrogenase XdhC/CoxF family maturation factor
MAEELAAAEKTGTKTGVLAMIVRKSGEAPRRPGTKMLVRNDGSFLGTVGGGYAEAEILKIAREMIAAGSPENRLVRVNMKKGARDVGFELTGAHTLENALGHDQSRPVAVHNGNLQRAGTGFGEYSLVAAFKIFDPHRLSFGDAKLLIAGQSLNRNNFNGGCGQSGSR